MCLEQSGGKGGQEARSNGQPPWIEAGANLPAKEVMESINVRRINRVIIMWTHSPLRSEGLPLLLHERKPGRDGIKMTQVRP